MGACEICGKNTSLLKAIVSGTELEVCETCSKFGKIIQKPQARSIPKISTESANLYSKQARTLEEPSLSIVADYASKIKNAREKMKLTHEDLSKKIAEKESMLHHIESGHHEPAISVARKLERFFEIALVEYLDEKKEASASLGGKKASEGMTLGDFMKIKKR